MRDDKAFAVVGVEVEFDDTLNAISSENGREANENITTTVLAVEESTNGEDTVLIADDGLYHFANGGTGSMPTTAAKMRYNLIAYGEQAWLDAGYAGMEDVVRAKHMTPIICEKGTRGHPLTEEQKVRNRQKSKVRSRVEHVFGFMEQTMGGLVFRGVGMVRAKANIALTNLVYNMCRLEQIKKYQPYLIATQ